MSDDIVERLRRWDDGRISTHYEGCWNSHPVCAILLAADAIEERDAEIERLRAEVERLRAENAELQDGQILNRWPLHKMLSAERALADQLADALRWQADPHQTGTLGITHKALDAYEEARRER